MTDLLALRRALLDVRRRLRACLAALAAQIVAPAPSDPRPNPAIHGGRNTVAAPRSARRAAAASRRVPPPPLQSSNPSTLQPWSPSTLKPPDFRTLLAECPGMCARFWIPEEVYLQRMYGACLRGTWNSRNPCPN